MLGKIKGGVRIVANVIPHGKVKLPCHLNGFLIRMNNPHGIILYHFVITVYYLCCGQIGQKLLIHLLLVKSKRKLTRT
jgi:hypothetical protein